MPIYRAAQGIGDFFGDIFSSSEAREEAGEALVTGIRTLAKDQMEAIFHMGVTGEPGFYDPEQGRAIRHDPFLIAAPGFAAGRLFPVEGAVSGMFAGRRAATADLPKLKVAEKMAAKRNYFGKWSSRKENEATRNDIFEETGWFRYHDQDGNPVHDWRFEISDDAARAVENKRVQTATGRLREGADPPAVVSDLLQHRPVFEAYSGAKPGENLAQQLDRVSSSAQVPLSLAEITRQRAAIKLKFDELNERGLDIDDPVFQAEYQRLQAEDGAILDGLIAGLPEEVSKKLVQPHKTTASSALIDRPLAEIGLRKKAGAEWGGADYSPWEDTIGTKALPGQAIPKKHDWIPWDEKGEYFHPIFSKKFIKMDKQARKTFKRAGISLDSSGSYDFSVVRRTGSVFEPSSGQGVKYSLRKWKGTDSIDPEDLTPDLKRVWDALHRPGTLHYKKNFVPSERFRSDMVHELQHAIQAREMWPHGSARTEFVRKLYPTSVTEKWRDPKTGEKLSAEQLYYRTFGEAEARNADARRDMTPEERKQPGKRPWETLDRDPKTGEKLEEGDLRTREQFGLPPHNVFTSGPDKVFTPGPDNIFKTSELNYLPESIGQVSDQIDKKVGRTNISLRPSEFLQLAEEFDPNTKSSADIIQFLEDAIRDSRAIAPPWLTVQWVPEKSAWKVLGHEGRHRVLAGEKVFGDENLPVHLFLRNSSDDGRLGRKIEVDQLSSEMQQALENRRFIPEKGEEIVGFPEPTGIAMLEPGREAGRAYDEVTGGAPTLKPLEEVSQSTLKRRLKNKKRELSDIIGMPIKRDITLRHQKKINKILEGADDLTTARINKLADDIYVLKERISPETRFGPSYRTHPDMTRWPLPEGQTSSENTIVGIMGELNLTEAIGPVKRRSGVIGQGTEGIMQRLWEMSPQDVKMTNAILKQKFNRGILEFEFPQDPDPNMLRVTTDHYGTPSDVKQRIESILEPSPQGPRIVKATGGFIDKPLYERTLYA
jgi:hypothetical protein